MNTLVNFELAKLLKEKGLDKTTYSNCWVKTLKGDIIHNQDRKDIPDHDRCTQYLMQPTIADVVMWLYEKHEIWVTVQMVFKEFRPYIQTDWNYKSEKQRKEVLEFMSLKFPTPTEAYQEAINYTLTNLL